MRRAWAGAVVLALALAGCQRSDSPDTGYAATAGNPPISLGAPEVVTSTPAAANSGTAGSGGCVVVAGKADRRCTPGVTNPDVTQANIGQTICVSGWTATIRPPAGYTTALKRSQMPQYGETGPLSGYEEDHLEPLELGGAPRDPHNLWPQPWNGAQGAHVKDQTENALHRAVCSGAMTLAAAQAQIAQQWTH